MRVVNNEGIRYLHDIFSNEIAFKEHIITRRIGKLPYLIILFCPSQIISYLCRSKQDEQNLFKQI